MENYLKTGEIIIVIVIICIVVSTILQIGMLDTLSKIKNEICQLKQLVSSKQKQTTQENQVAQSFCQNCGIKYEKSANQQYCANCGKSLS